MIPFSGRAQAQNNTILNLIPGLSTSVLKLAVSAYHCLESRQRIHNPFLSIVDYSLSSNKKRLWVIDMNKHELTHYTWVTHATNSGGLYAEKFSNSLNTHQSSLGVFLTENTYKGHYGYSLVLDGLEPGINDHTKERNIVLHGASVVNAYNVKKYGALLRSWGCLAISEEEAEPLIDQIKGGSMLFVYAPEEKNDLHLQSCRFS